MNQHHFTRPPVIRAGNLILPAVKMKAMGIPVSRLFDRAGIPEDIMETPEVLVSLPNTIRFLDMAAKDAGVPNLGLHTGEMISIGDLGLYGQILDRSVTVHDYLRLGIPLYSSHSNFEYFWLEHRANSVRLHHELRLEPSLGTVQADLNSFAIVINKFREALGPDWMPGKISVAWECTSPIAGAEGFRNANIITGSGKSYMELNSDELQARFPTDINIIEASRPQRFDEMEPLPTRLIDVVALQIEKLVSTSQPNIQLVAETLGMRIRTLQHHLALSGVTFRQLLGESRFRLATSLLENGNKPIHQIAHELGYQDTANFSRAFRKLAGISPSVFRHSTTA